MGSQVRAVGTAGGRVRGAPAGGWRLGARESPLRDGRQAEEMDRPVGVQGVTEGRTPTGRLAFRA